jgi:hypothetical protein
MAEGVKGPLASGPKKGAKEGNRKLKKKGPPPTAKGGK